MRTPTKFANRLRAIRERKGISQADLARMADIAPTQLSRYEVGRAIPRSDVIGKLARALDVEMAELSALDDLTLQVQVTADMMETLKLEAKHEACSVEDVVSNRLIGSFFPGAEIHFQKELLEYLQTVVAAFESTSDDFEKELGERMAKHLARLIRRNEQISADRGDPTQMVRTMVSPEVLERFSTPAESAAPSEDKRIGTRVVRSKKE